MAHEPYDDHELLSQPTFKEFVPVVFANGRMQAHAYKTLLETQNIPALVEEQQPESLAAPASQAVAVLVPDEMLEQASEIIDQKSRDEDDQEDQDQDDQQEQDYQLDEDEDQEYEEQEESDEQDLFEQDQQDQDTGDK